MTKEERIKKYNKFKKLIGRMEKELGTISDEFRLKLLDTKYTKEEENHIFFGSSLTCPISLLLIELRSHIEYAAIEARHGK